jgi:NADH:ubiquinone oxidoreductase subunit C
MEWSESVDNTIEKIVKVLQEKAGATFEEFRGEVHVFVNADKIVDCLTFLRDGHAFSLLSVLTAVDYWSMRTSSRYRPRRVYSRLQIGASAKSMTCSASSSKVIPTRAAF